MHCLAYSHYDDNDDNKNNNNNDYNYNDYDEVKDDDNDDDDDDDDGDDEKIHIWRCALFCWNRIANSPCTPVTYLPIFFNVA